MIVYINVQKIYKKSVLFEHLCVVLTEACQCVWAVPRPGLEGLSEISFKRITDHASLAYWFTAKNTYAYTQNLLLLCSDFSSFCLEFFSFTLTGSPAHYTYRTHTWWINSLGVQEVLHDNYVCILLHFPIDKRETKQEVLPEVLKSKLTHSK